MPWTFSHPAIVFPLKHSRWGRFLNLPALILGSLSPDLLYSFGLYRFASTAHHVVGWFYTAFPLCIFIYVMVYLLIEPLKQIIPFPMQKNKLWNRRYFFILILSLFLGAMTHIIWDSFTHESGAVVRNFSLLQFNFIHMSDKQEIAIYKLLQHMGSLLGLIYLCFKYYQYHKTQPNFIQTENVVKLKNLSYITVISGGLALPVAYYLTPRVTSFHFNRFVYLELTLTVPFFFGLVVIFALLKHYQLLGRCH